MNGKDGKPGVSGAPETGLKNWKECAWYNINDNKDVGLVKVTYCQIYYFSIISF